MERGKGEGKRKTKVNLAKVIAVVMASVVAASFLGFVLRIIKPQTFWLVTIAAAIMAYWLLPRMRGNANGKHNVEKSK